MVAHVGLPSLCFPQDTVRADGRTAEAVGGFEETPMDQKIVEKLERQIEEALADILIRRNKGWRWPLMPAGGRCN